MRANQELEARLREAGEKFSHALPARPELGRLILARADREPRTGRKLRRALFVEVAMTLVLIAGAAGLGIAIAHSRSAAVSPPTPSTVTANQAHPSFVIARDGDYKLDLNFGSCPIMGFRLSIGSPTGTDFVVDSRPPAPGDHGLPATMTLTRGTWTALFTPRCDSWILSVSWIDTGRTVSPTPSASPVVESTRAYLACLTGRYQGAYLVGAFDSTAEKLTAWGRRLLPGLGTQPLPWAPYPSGMYVAICIYGHDGGFPGVTTIRAAPLPDRVALAVGANGVEEEITLGFRSTLPPVNPAP